MTANESRRNGQALLLVTLSLFAMCGILGLAVDLGWSYFVKKSAQGAVDAAAMAAAYQALQAVGQTGTFSSNTYTLSSQCPDSSDATKTISSGCQYASWHGFDPANGNQNVTMETGVGHPNDCNLPPPTAPCVAFDYWATARAIQFIPQLFSAVIGNPQGQSSARATAAVFTTTVNGSLVTLNRAADGLGNNVTLTGNGEIDGSSGLVVSSSAPGTIQPNGNIGDPSGAATPIIGLNPLPNPDAGGNNTFQTQPDGSQFLDPMRGLGQPPLTSSVLPTYAVLNGDLNGTIYPVDHQTGHILTTILPSNPVNIQSGNYFATTAPVACAGSLCASPQLGQPISASGTVNFCDSFNGTTCTSSFGYYNFFQGLSVSTGTLNTYAGEYVVVGGTGLNVTGGTISDPSAGSDAGQIFIVTGTSSPVNGGNDASNNLYPGLATQINGDLDLGVIASNGANLLAFAGTNWSLPGNATDPQGLNNCGGCGLPSNPGQDLRPFAGVVYWQDQANTTIKYTSDGNIDTSCGGINTPCKNAYPVAPTFALQAHGGDIGLKGIVYQPRGSSLSISGTGTGALQIITGSVNVGSGKFVLTNPPTLLKRRIVALVE